MSQRRIVARGMTFPWTTFVTQSSNRSGNEEGNRNSEVINTGHNQSDSRFFSIQVFFVSRTAPLSAVEHGYVLHRSSLPTTIQFKDFVRRHGSQWRSQDFWIRGAHLHFQGFRWKNLDEQKTSCRVKLQSFELLSFILIIISYYLPHPKKNYSTDLLKNHDISQPK